jgi:amidase
MIFVANAGNAVFIIQRNLLNLFPPSTISSPSLFDLNSFETHPVLTLSVRDSAAMLDATAGPNAGAPYFAPPPTRPFLEEVTTAPGRLRIAFTDKPFLGNRVDDACREGLANTVTLLQELGHEVIEDAPVFDGMAMARAFLMMLAAETCADIEAGEKLLGRKATTHDYEQDTWALGLLGKQISAGEFVQAIRQFQLVSRVVGAFFTDYDVLLTPTLAEPPIFTGSLGSPKGEAIALQVLNWLNAGKILNTMGMIDTVAERVFQFTPYTTVFNVTGNPAMSVPLHWSNDGLPVGLHFVGRYAEEATLFRLAGQLEQARPWFDKTPQMGIKVAKASNRAR